MEGWGRRVFIMDPVVREVRFMRCSPVLPSKQRMRVGGFRRRTFRWEVWGGVRFKVGGVRLGV